MQDVERQTGKHQLLLDSFLRALRAENLAPRTLDTYGESLDQFSQFLTSHGMPLAPSLITREYVEAFITDIPLPAEAGDRQQPVPRPSPVFHLAC